MNRTHILFILVALLVVPSAALASGFDTARFGAEYGHAAAPTPLASFYNPAALTGTRKIHAVLEGTYALRVASFDRRQQPGDTYVGPKDVSYGRTELKDFLAGPTFAASLNSRYFALGVGFYAAYSGFARWGGNDKYKGNTTYPGAQDGVARFHIIEGDMNSIYTSIAAAVKLPNEGISLGLAGHVVSSRVNVTRASSPSYTDDPTTEGRSNTKVDGVVGTFSAGVLLEPFENKLWLGISYMAPQGGYNGVKLKGHLKTNLGGTTRSTPVDLHQTFPDTVRFALRAKPSELYELRLFGDFTRWSAFGDQCLTTRGDACDLNEDGSEKQGSDVQSNFPHRWQDAASIRVSGSYWFTPGWEGILGAGYDSNAVPSSELEPSLLDGDDFSASIGSRIRLGKRAALMATYTHVHWLTRTTTGESELSTKYEPPSKLPSAGGEYKQWVGILDTYFEFYFD